MILLLGAYSFEEQNKFNYIYDKYHRRLYNYAYKKLDSQQDTEDVIQRTFEQVLKALGKIADVDSAETSGLLFIILKRIIIKKREEDTRQDANSIDLISPTDYEQSFDPVWEKVAPRLSVDELKSVLNDLVEEDLLLFIGKSVYQYSYKELGNLLGITEKSASVRYSRLRQRILKEWGGKFGHE